MIKREAAFAAAQTVSSAGSGHPVCKYMKTYIYMEQVFEYFWNLRKPDGAFLVGCCFEMSFRSRKVTELSMCYLHLLIFSC